MLKVRGDLLSLLFVEIFLAITAVGIGSASAQVCTNGSAVDCNTAGSTLIASSAFVDPTPPAGYTQCAGFINTSDDDVRWDWENNCAGLVDETGGGLFMRVYDDATGIILSGARLYAGVPLGFTSTGFNFRADLNEGEGFLDNPTLNDSIPGTSLPFSPTDTSFCGCGRPPSGSGPDSVSAWRSSTSYTPTGRPRTENVLPQGTRPPWQSVVTEGLQIPSGPIRGPQS